MTRRRSNVTMVTISARVSPELLSRLRAEANTRGQDISVYLREFWADPSNVSGPTPVRPEPRKSLAPAVVLDADLRRELANIGNNINQVARGMNMLIGRDSVTAHLKFLGRMIEAQRDLHRLVELLSMPKTAHHVD